jgi:hypothetical protein
MDRTRTQWVKVTAVGAIAAAALIAGLLGIGGCGPSPKGQPFTITWNFDTDGYLEPCGCSLHQLGGLSRRATKIAEIRAEKPVFAIEGPRNFEEGGDFKLFKSQIMVKALNAMGYDAMMLGVREAGHGRSGMQTLIDAATFPVFSANLKVTGASWPQKMVIKEIAGSRLAVTGVSQPGQATSALPEGVTFEDPLTALEKALDGIRERADLVVVCLEGETPWIESILQRFGGSVDLFLTGDMQGITILSGSEIRKRLVFQEDPPLLNNLAEGRYLGMVEVTPKRGGYSFSGANFPLGDEVADDPGILEIMAKDFRPHLVEYFAQFTDRLPQTRLSAKTCADCHPDQYDVYASSGHFRSMETLKTAGQLYNPDCMGCHLAYDPEKDKLETMHCVSCHGNIIWDHAFKAEVNMVQMPDPPVTAYTYEWCARCHDPENSLPFEGHWPQYVHQIYHGGDLSKAEAAAKRMGLDMNEPPPDLVSPPRK